MYKNLTAQEYRAHFNLRDNYTVAGLLVYGTYKSHPFEQFENSLKKLGYEYKISKLDHEFFGSIVELETRGKKFWLAIAYGGALLSEYLHLACLFGSQNNVLIGTCGGLKSQANSLELIIPTWSYATESSARAYQPTSKNKYMSDVHLSNRLAKMLASKNIIHKGATVTFQAMLAETWDDIKNWSSEGYIAVEMEAATVFAVSNHFKVPSAAILVVGDNLIKEQTTLTQDYKKEQAKRREVAQNILDVTAKVLFS